MFLLKNEALFLRRNHNHNQYSLFAGNTNSILRLNRKDVVEGMSACKFAKLGKIHYCSSSSNIASTLISRKRPLNGLLHWRLYHARMKSTYVDKRYDVKQQVLRNCSKRLFSIENPQVENEHLYSVNVVTGVRRGAGTTAQVFIQLLGTLGKTELIPLSGEFDRGTTVSSIIATDQDLGEVKSIVIGHDNFGDLGVGWFLDHVEVSALDDDISTNGEHDTQPKIRSRHFFPVNKWLGRADFGYEEEADPVVRVDETETTTSLPVRSEDTRTDVFGVKSKLELRASGFAFPHPDKVQKGVRAVIQSDFGHAGEDSFSIAKISENLIVCTLADGVQAWSRMGIDAGELSRTVVKHIKQESMGRNAEDLDAKALLTSAEDEVKKKELKGSSTVSVNVINGLKSVLNIASLGDSGVCVIRGGIVVFKTQEQEHVFGQPFQLPSDSAKECIVYNVNIVSGDVIIIGSDGVFDNLHEHELEEIVRNFVTFKTGDLNSNTLMIETKEFLWSKSSPRKLAAKICEAAFNNSTHEEKQTPYSAAASEEFNMVYSGGKKDDISCIVCLVHASTGEN